MSSAVLPSSSPGYPGWCNAFLARVRGEALKVRALELLMKYHGMLRDKPPADVMVKALG
jgi:hypothetical protein